jgi:hypothetical protein
MNLRNVKSALSAGVSMVRRGIPITLLVLACNTGFATPPRGAIAAAAATRQTLPPACVGDCDNSGTVTVDEIITGVNIALGLLALGQCPAFACMPRARSRSVASFRRSMRHERVRPEPTAEPTPPPRHRRAPPPVRRRLHRRALQSMRRR